MTTDGQSGTEPQPAAEATAAHMDELLNEALEMTFPASDPIALHFDRKTPSVPIASAHELSLKTLDHDEAARAQTPRERTESDAGDE